MYNDIHRHSSSEEQSSFKMLWTIKRKHIRMLSIINSKMVLIVFFEGFQDTQTPHTSVKNIA